MILGRGGRGQRRWRVEVSDGVEDFETTWRQLATPRTSTPFQNFELTRLFNAALADRGGAEPVVARVSRSDGRPAALLAMTRLRRHGLDWLVTDARPLDYCAPILAPDVTGDEIPGLVGAVMAAVPGADLLYCNKMPGSFEGAANPFVGLANTHRLRLSAWLLPLAGRDREAVLSGEHASFRKNRRRCAGKLAKAHRVGFSIAVGTEITEADLALFSAMRTESTREKGRDDILDDPDWAGFYRGLFAGRASPMLPWLSRLEADGEAIAMLFGLSDGRRPVAILAASRLGPWKPYAPGLQLFEQTILHFHAAGAEIFDMSIGDMVYKRRFGCDRLALHDALFPSSLAGHAYYRLWQLKMMVRDRMKPIMDAA